MFAALVCLQWSSALAFHDEGVARCGGCHTMHNTDGNFAPIDPSGNGYLYLLKYSNSTDLCLSCHGTQRGAVWAASPTAPGAERGPGNFAFLLEDNINDGYNGASSPIAGYRAGHTVISPSKGTVVDATNPNAPGGTFPSSQLTCTSCHDPHGNANYRLLYGDGDHTINNYQFTEDAPNAEGLPFSADTVNNILANETDANHIAYKGGMSAWCSNCHGNFHANSVQRRHPSGVGMSSAIIATYDRYNGTTDQNGAVHATAFTANVPFEDPGMTYNWTAGPDNDSQVSCITCHRAHATSAQNSGRWDFNIAMFHSDGLASGSWVMPQTYNNPNQRSLCNKCHNKDVHSATPY
jgi:predicted CXXCH cytochrome family protein